MGLDSVLSAIRRDIANAINAANIPQQGQVIKGWPTAPQLVEILAQPNNEWQVSIYPLPARSATRWLEASLGYTAPQVYLAASVAGDTLTLTEAGTPPSDAGDVNIHAFIKGVNADVYAVGSPTESLDDIAIAVAAAVNALSRAGITATPSANTVVLSGALWDSVNVGGTGSFITEANRDARLVQVTIWATGGTTSDGDIDHTLRFSLVDAIKSNLGTRRKHFIRDETGTQVYINYHGETPDDDSQSSYSLYASIIYFDVEYSVQVVTPATQIGVAIPTITVDLTHITTDFIGGP